MRPILKLLVISLLVYRLVPAAQSPAKTDSASQEKIDNSKQAFITESYRTIIDFQADGTSATVTTAQIRVLSEAGVEQFGLLVFPYSGANEQLKIDYVRVRKADGTVVETPLGSVQDMPATITRVAPMYSDYRERHVPVKGLGVGDLLEYQSETKLIHPLIPGEFWFEYSFTKNGVVKQEELQVSFPKNKYVQVKSPDTKPMITEQANRRVYEWNHTNTEVQVSGNPSVVSSPPSIQITTFRSWQEVGHWWSGLESQAATPTPDIRAKATELTKGMRTDDEKLRAIYHYVSTQFRYISISFGIGRYRPHPASQVLSNMYGDCKDKHVLLASLLEAAGLDAYPALINSSRKIDPDVPSPGQFDHVISVVPEGQSLIWLDTTAEVAPVGFLMRNLRGKQALLIPQRKEPSLVETPADPPFKSFQNFEADGKLGDDGTFTGKMHNSLRGDYGVALRILFFMTPQPQWQNLVQRISQLSGFGGDVSNVTVSDPANTGKPFEYSYDYTRKTYSDWANKRILPALPPMALPDWTKELTKVAKPLQLGSPVEITLKSSIELPKGYTPALPSPMNVSRDFAEYHANYSDKAGGFYSERRLIIKEREVSAASRAEYKAFLKAVRDDQNQFITLTNSTAAATVNPPINPEAVKLFSQARDAYMERNIYGAVEGLEQAVKLDPQFAQAWTALGGFYLALHRQDDGESALRTAIRLQPKTPGPYMILATFLARTRRQPEAILVWRDLLKQDPNNAEAHAVLGSLLLQTKKYNEAIPELEAAVKQNSQSVLFETQLGMAALSAGKIQEGTAALKTAAKLAPTPDTLNNVAYYLADHGVDLPDAQEYAEKAVKTDEEAASQISLDKLKDSDLILMVRLAREWDTLGWVYYREGKLQEADRYLEAAWNLEQAQPIADHLGQLYEKLNRRQAAIHMYALAAACPDAQSGSDDRDLARLIQAKARRDADVSRAREEVSQMRRVKLGKISSTVGSAEFIVLFAPGAKIEGVKFASGSEQLRSAAKVISLARFKAPLPDDVPTQIIRRGVMVCEGMSLGCDFTLFTPDSVHSIR